MRWLTRIRSHASRRLQGERGGAAVIVAVLFSGLMIIGMLAVSVDLGNLTYERRQLQNGADATSLALAQECAEDAAGCAPTAVSDLLNPNAGDERMQYDNRTVNGAPNGACGRGIGSLPTCLATGSIGDLGECPPLPSWLTGTGASIPYVETYTRTLTTSGDDELFLPFSRVLTGGSDGDSGTTACARAAYGPAGSTGNTLPITIGACDWVNKTSVGGVPGSKYAPSPPYTPAPNGSAPPVLPTSISSGDYATGIFTHDSADHKCEGSPGATYPGGFSWLDNEGCVADVSDGWVGGGPGTSEGCLADELKKYIGTEVFIPIYVETKGTGGGAEYKISGVASFYFAGWNGVSSAAPTKSYDIYQRPATVCTGKCNDSVSYIWGWFTSSLKPVDSGGLGGEDRGARSIVPAG